MNEIGCPGNENPDYFVSNLLGLRTATIRIA